MDRKVDHHRLMFLICLVCCLPTYAVPFFGDQVMRIHAGSEEMLRRQLFRVVYIEMFGTKPVPRILVLEWGCDYSWLPLAEAFAANQ